MITPERTKVEIKKKKKNEKHKSKNNFEITTAETKNSFIYKLKH